jgi:hypothetical protein
MRPETLHLIVTVFRHARGVLNAIEKFERSVPREHRSSEIAVVMDFARETITAVESTLYAAPTD